MTRSSKRCGKCIRQSPNTRGTANLQAEIRRKINHLRKTVARKPSKGADPFYVPKGGAGQVVLIGTPNAGKMRWPGG